MAYSFGILDPEPEHALQLEGVLSEFGDLYRAFNAEAVPDATEETLRHRPDIIFVSLVTGISEILPMVHELHALTDSVPSYIGYARSREHAYDALKAGFIDYWLLPFAGLEVRKGISRLRKFRPADPEPTTICLKSYGDFQYLNTEDVLYLKADNNSTDFKMRDGRTICAYKTLKSFEESLPKHFVRVHQSYIINSHHLSRINYGKSLCSLRDMDVQLPFSRSYRGKVDELKELLTQNAIKTSS